MTKWVYSFGAGHNEGGADMRNLLGGKGANLAEMAIIGLPVPPGFTTHHRGLHRVLREPTQNTRTIWSEQVARRSGQLREGQSAEVRRQAQAAAGLGPLRRAGLDARDDGYGAQSRPERRDRRGPRRGRRRCRASPGTATAASSRCTARSCSASITIGSRRSSSTPSSTPA